MDSKYGSQKERAFMKWNSNKNAFDVISDGEGKYLPMKWELTPFKRSDRLVVPFVFRMS